MKRDARLRTLSSEHHNALVLARALSRHAAAGTADAAVVRDLRARFERELQPHFRIEEQLLLPALRALGDDALADRVEGDHSALRAHLDAAERGEAGHVASFAELLTEHVRFEERELFPSCEARLPGAVLDAVAHSSDPQPARPLVAGIFVGGASTRFGGRPKGLLEAPAGGTIVEVLRGHLEALAIPWVLVGRRAEYAGVPAETLDDSPPGIGPLGGLLALLRRAGDGRAIAIACDMPFVSRELIARLAGAVTDAPAIAPRRNGRWEPMFARYDAQRSLAVAEARATGGRRSVQGLLDELGASELTLTSDEQRMLEDWDSPEDMERR
jgi:molybdopterin-guanine dinucleotide biosynthesis protein A/hemerythrin-like domain-containing protein